jgi:3-isopropylmalate/(R)-2-methylmalate dehydratase large subunit
MAQTLFDKIWNKHVISSNAGFADTLYIDVHLINKITSARAFEGLRKRNISVFRPAQTLLLKDPAYSQHLPVSDLSRFQLDLYNRNCGDFGLEKFDQNYVDQSDSLIAYPGQILVFDANHTDDLGAFGVLSININELQVEQILATQCLLMFKPKRMKVEVNGRLTKGLGVKDINHFLLSEISAEEAKGYFIEYSGDTIMNLDMDERMAICNMSREIGALGGFIAPDETTFEFLRLNSVIAESEHEEETLSFWRSLYSDESCVFDEVLEFDAEDIEPGNHGIGLSRLIHSKPANDRSEMISHDGAAIISGYNDTDYLLNHLEGIKEFESSTFYKIFDGA